MQRQGSSRKAAVTHCVEDDAQYGVNYCLLALSLSLLFNTQQVNIIQDDSAV